MDNSLRQKITRAIKKDKGSKLQSLIDKIDQPLNSYDVLSLVQATTSAISYGSVECLNVLLDLGINVNAIYSDRPLLHHGFTIGNTETIKVLVSRGASVNGLNFYGQSALSNAIQLNSSVITEEIISLFKENGYDPKAQFVVPNTDWSIAESYNKEIFSLFKKVYGEDYTSAMNLSEAKRSNDVEYLDNVLTEYFTRLGVIGGKGVSLTSFYANEAELLMKTKLLKGDKDEAFMISYDIVMAELRGSSSSSVQLVQNLIRWSRGAYLSEVHAEISKTESSGRTVSTRNICHIGMNYLFNKEIDTKLALKSFKAFKDFVETEAIISPTNRDIFKTLFQVMLGEKPSQEEFSNLFNREYDCYYPKHKIKLLFAIAFYIAGDTVNGELFLRKAMVCAKNPDVRTKTDFEDFFLLLLTDSMINELNKGAA